MVRATFAVTFSGNGSEISKNANALSERLSEEGLIFDEDFTNMNVRRDEQWTTVGVRLHSLAAVEAAIRILPELDAYMIETNEELAGEVDHG